MSGIYPRHALACVPLPLGSTRRYLGQACPPPYLISYPGHVLAWPPILLLLSGRLLASWSDGLQFFGQQVCEYFALLYLVSLILPPILPPILHPCSSYLGRILASSGPCSCDVIGYILSAV